MFTKQKMYVSALGLATALLMAGCGTAGVDEVASTQSAAQSSPPVVSVTLAPAQPLVKKAEPEPLPLETNEVAPPAIVNVPLPTYLVEPGEGVKVDLPGCATVYVLLDADGFGWNGELYVGANTSTVAAALALSVIDPDVARGQLQKCFDDAIGVAKKEPSVVTQPIAKPPVATFDRCNNFEGHQDVAPEKLLSVPSVEKPGEYICRDPSWMSDEEKAMAVK